MDSAEWGGLSWRHGSTCADHACVEVAVNGDRIYLRDGKRQDSAVLEFTRAEWEAFLRGAKSGDFDSL